MSDREQSYLFRQVVPLRDRGDTFVTDWFDQPEEGRLVQVEWHRSTATLTFMVTRYPALTDGGGS